MMTAQIKSIKFLDLQAINQSFEPELSAAVKRVTDSGWYLFGEELKSFEKEYAAFIGTRHCIGTANGFDALRLILKAYLILGEMTEGDEIIVPANTYIASILAITENRLIPVLVEPDILTYNIHPDLIEEKITERTKGIMLVHLYGLNAMNPEIKRLADKYELKVIEDNAQSHGCCYNNKRTGSLGHAAGHSFYPGKNLGALGDAGAVTTDNDQLASLIRILGNYGSSQKYRMDYQGANFQTFIHYPVPPHKQKVYRNWNSLNLPVTEKIHNEVLSLPVSPLLKEEEVRYITEKLNKM